MTEGVVVDGVGKGVPDVGGESFSEVGGYLNHFLEEETEVAHVDGFDCHFWIGWFATDGGEEDKFIGSRRYVFNFFDFSFTDGRFLGDGSGSSSIRRSIRT